MGLWDMWRPSAMYLSGVCVLILLLIGLVVPSQFVLDLFTSVMLPFVPLFLYLGGRAAYMKYRLGYVRQLGFTEQSVEEMAELLHRRVLRVRPHLPHTDVHQEAKETLVAQGAFISVDDAARGLLQAKMDASRIILVHVLRSPEDNSYELRIKSKLQDPLLGGGLRWGVGAFSASFCEFLYAEQLVAALRETQTWAVLDEQV